MTEGRTKPNSSSGKGLTCLNTLVFCLPSKQWIRMSNMNQGDLYIPVMYLLNKRYYYLSILDICSEGNQP